MKEKINLLLKQWDENFADMRQDLYQIGDRPESFHYNLLATQALQLSECINDLTRLLVEGE